MKPQKVHFSGVIGQKTFPSTGETKVSKSLNKVHAAQWASFLWKWVIEINIRQIDVRDGIERWDVK